MLEVGACYETKSNMRVNLYGSHDPELKLYETMQIEPKTMFVVLENFVDTHGLYRSALVLTTTHVGYVAVGSGDYISYRFTKVADGV